MVPTQVDKYELLEEVGSGGMAVVYRGRDTVLEREVAVKVMHPHLARNTEARKRFLREAKAVARLHHPGIIEIYAYSGEDAEQEFIVAEFIRGRNLREFARRLHIRSPEAAALICFEIAGALGHAHANGVVHRDIKPDNVMVSYDSQIKIADFGIAHILEAEHLTVTGAMLGSPAHMSPEQIEGKPSDSRSDIFSLGTILYWLATEKMPFEGDSPTAMFRNIMEGRYTDPRVLNHSVDNRLAAIISRMLAVKPADRYQDMGQVRTELNAWLSDSGLTDPKSELRSLLEDPGKYLAGMGARVIPALRSKAAADLKEGRYASAMNYCNRILAMAPDDAGTLNLIKSADRKRLVGRVVLPAAAAIIIITAVALFAGWRWFGWWRAPAPESSASNTPAAASGTSWALLKAPQPSQETGPAGQKPGQTVRSMKSPPGVGKAVVRNVRSISIPKQVRIFVKPYGDIYADGKLLASDTRDTIAPLAPGRHRLEFKNRYFENQELLIDVPETGDTHEFRVEMTKVKPSFLSVTSTPPAEVYIDDVYKGSSAATLAEPVMIPMTKDRGSRTVHLKVMVDGYKTFMQPVELQPGVTKNLKVRLEQK
jgi:serine/threonine-protein kinase